MNYMYKERGESLEFPLSKIDSWQEFGMEFGTLTIQGQRQHLSFHVWIGDDLWRDLYHILQLGMFFWLYSSTLLLLYRWIILERHQRSLA